MFFKLNKFSASESALWKFNSFSIVTYQIDPNSRLLWFILEFVKNTAERHLNQFCNGVSLENVFIVYQRQRYRPESRNYKHFTRKINSVMIFDQFFSRMTGYLWECQLKVIWLRSGKLYRKRIIEKGRLKKLFAQSVF